MEIKDPNWKAGRCREDKPKQWKRRLHHGLDDDMPGVRLQCVGGEGGRESSSVICIVMSVDVDWARLYILLNLRAAYIKKCLCSGHINLSVVSGKA